MGTGAESSLAQLRHALDLLLGAGMAEDAVDHARQVAMITSLIGDAFEAAGMRVTLVGGSAIEVYAPGLFKSGDIDLVIESLTGTSRRELLDPVFATLTLETLQKLNADIAVDGQEASSVAVTFLKSRNFLP